MHLKGGTETRGYGLQIRGSSLDSHPLVTPMHKCDMTALILGSTYW